MKILIVGPSWVGDMVMAQTLFQCLKQRHPQCEIDVLAPEWSRPILERMPEVRKALSFPLGHGALELATRRRIGKSLAGQYDQAILLPNSLKSALVPFFAGIPRRTGYVGEARYGNHRLPGAHPALVTLDEFEIQSLDNAIPNRGWERTGETWR